MTGKLFTRHVLV